MTPEPKEPSDLPENANGTTAIGFTLFKPDAALLEALLDAVEASGRPAYAFVDGPDETALDPATARILRARPALRVMQGAINEGIGVALNALAEAAMRDGHRRILLLDQDTTLPPDLLGGLEGAFDRLAQSRHHPAVVGPRPVPAPGSGTKAPHYHRRGAAVAGSLYPVDFVITSGSLVDLDAFRQVGAFRQTFGMDAIDFEWCLRAWSLGLSVWLDDALEMPHRIGEGVIAVGPFRFPLQSPERMRNYVRNQARCLTLPYVPLRWKARSCLYIPLQILAFALHSKRPAATVGDLLKAVATGLGGRFER